MRLLFLWYSAVTALPAFHPPGNPELIDCILGVAERYFGQECLSFFFPMNPSSPSASEAPDLARSDLLKKLHHKWSPYLPTAYYNKEYDLTWELHPPGLLLYLECNYIIILGPEEDFIAQLSRILYPMFNYYYSFGGSPTTRMVLATDAEVSDDKVYNVLNHLYLNGDLNAVLVSKRDQTFLIHTFFPYGKDGKSCPESNRRVEVLDEWKYKSFITGDELFPEKIPKKFNDCEVSATAAHNPPYFMATKKDGALTSVDGIDYLVSELLAELLNLKMNYITYDSVGGWLYKAENGTVKGGVVDLHTGKAWWLIGGAADNRFLYPGLLKTYTVSTCSWSWYFQLPDPVASWKLIYLAFNYLLWMSVLAVLIFIPVVFYVLSKFSEGKTFWRRYSNCFMDLFRTTLGSSAIAAPYTKVMRLLFAVWLFCTIHLNCAYTASLTGLIAGGKLEPIIKTFHQLYESRLPTAAHEFLIKLMNTTKEHPIDKIISRCINSDNQTVFIDMMMKYKNVTIIDNDILIEYAIKKHKYAIFRSELYFSQFHTGIIMKRNHFLFEKSAKLTSRIGESGFIDKLIKDFTMADWKRTKEDTFKAVTLRDMYGPIIILILGYCMAAIAFIFEILKKEYFDRL